VRTPLRSSTCKTPRRRLRRHDPERAARAFNKGRGAFAKSPVPFFALVSSTVSPNPFGDVGRVPTRQHSTRFCAAKQIRSPGRCGVRRALWTSECSGRAAKGGTLLRRMRQVRVWRRCECGKRPPAKTVRRPARSAGAGWVAKEAVADWPPNEQAIDEELGNLGGVGALGDKQLLAAWRQGEQEEPLGRAALNLCRRPVVPLPSPRAVRTPVGKGAGLQCPLQSADEPARRAVAHVSDVPDCARRLHLA
jgi:hypothetical protein